MWSTYRPAVLVLGLSVAAGFALMVPALADQSPLSEGSPASTPPYSPPATHAANTPAPRTDQFWIDRHALCVARAIEASSRGDIDVVFLGDSITQGWEHDGRESWEAEFSGRLRDGVPTPRGLNLGISGDRTEHVLRRLLDGTLDPLAAPSHGRPPRVVVIMIGTNNSHGDQFTASQIADGIVAVTRLVRSRLPGARVLLLDIFPRSKNPDTQRAKVQSASEHARRDLAGEPWILHMDLGRLFTRPDGSLDLDLMPDALHLSPSGYRVWAGAIRDPIGRMTCADLPLPGSPVVDLRGVMRSRGMTVRQQGDRDAGTVYALAAALEFAVAEGLPQGEPAPDFSEAYLMWAANQVSRDSGLVRDSGVMEEPRIGGFDLASLANGLREWGVCDETMMPTAARREAIPEADEPARAQGRKRRVYSLTSMRPEHAQAGFGDQDLVGVMRSLDHGRPVVAEFTWPTSLPRQAATDERAILTQDRNGSGFEDPTGHEVGSPGTGLRGTFRHGVLIVGYSLGGDRSGEGWLIARTSLGEWFGDRGDVLIPFEYARENGLDLYELTRPK